MLLAVQLLQAGKIDRLDLTHADGMKVRMASWELHALFGPRGLRWLLRLALCFWPMTANAADPPLRIDTVWRYHAPSGACEIACFAPESGRLFVTTASGVDIVDARSGRSVGNVARPDGYHSTSVACSQGRLAVAWAADDRSLPGQIAMFAVDDDGQPTPTRTFPAGYLPDMVVFSPDGRYLLAANEGEPTDDYAVDPEGSITVIDTAAGLDEATVRQATFVEFNSQRDELRTRGVRIFGPSKRHDDGQATVAEDLEPEYIAVSPDCRRAWVSLQENNAVAEVDLAKCRITAIHALGAKDFRRSTDAGSRFVMTGLDPSDADGGVRIRHWPVLGLRQPDGIAALTHQRVDYLLTINEGDPRRYPGFDEPCPAGQLADRGIALDQRLKARLLLSGEQLGRLEVSTELGDTDGDGDFDALYTFGTRSFSIWRMAGRRPPELVFDSGQEFEWITSHDAAHRYNADSTPTGIPDECSPKRGPEPESVAVGRVGASVVAAIGLEKTGGAMLYDVTDPTAPAFLKYIPALDEDGVLDCAPEGLVMIPAEVSPLGKTLLVLCHEASGTATAYALGW